MGGGFANPCYMVLSVSCGLLAAGRRISFASGLEVLVLIICCLD